MVIGFAGATRSACWPDACAQCVEACGMPGGAAVGGDYMGGGKGVYLLGEPTTKLEDFGTLKTNLNLAESKTLQVSCRRIYFGGICLVPS